MLEEYKNLYQQCADRLDFDWRNANKNDLCRQYVENHDERVLSAIICRYWKNIDKYYAQSRFVATPEDCYDWLIRSVMYALNSAVWLNPKHKLYGDKNAPDKTINRVLKCTRFTFYQQLNYDKRKVHSDLLSTESLFNESSDNEPEYYEDYSLLDIQQVVKWLFAEKDYFTAILIDIIAYHDSFSLSENNEYTWSIYKIANIIHHIDDDFIKSFSERYELAETTVRYAVQYIVCIDTAELKKKIPRTLKQLKRLYLKGASE